MSSNHDKWMFVSTSFTSLLCHCVNVRKTLIASNRRFHGSPINFNYKLFKNVQHFSSCQRWCTTKMWQFFFRPLEFWLCDCWSRSEFSRAWWERGQKRIRTSIKILRQIFPHQHVEFMVVEWWKKIEIMKNAYNFHRKIIHFEVFVSKCFIISSFNAFLCRCQEKWAYFPENIKQKWSSNYSSRISNYSANEAKRYFKHKGTSFTPSAHRSLLLLLSSSSSV